MNLPKTAIQQLMNGQSVPCCIDCNINISSNNSHSIEQFVDKKVYNTTGNTAITSHCNLMHGDVQSRCYNHIGWIEPHIICHNNNNHRNQKILQNNVIHNIIHHDKPNVSNKNINDQ
jgi:hypothetical protein